MSDHQVKIKVGVNSSAVKTGLHEVKSQFEELGHEIKGSLAGALGAVGLFEGAKEMIEKARTIKDLSEQFGIAASALQGIGNVAKQNGAALETTAAGLNKLILAQEKVREGDEKATRSLDDLKISAAEFINLSPDEAFLRLADGVKNAEDRTGAYAAVVELMGRKGGALFSTLEMGSEKIKKVSDDMGAMSDATIASLDAIGKAVERLTNRLTNRLGGAVAALVKSVSTLFNFTDKVGKTLGSAIFGGDEGYRDRLKAIIEEFHKEQDEIWHPKSEEDGKPKAHLDVEDDGEDKKKEALDKRREKLLEEIRDDERKWKNEELEDAAKINALIAQRNALFEDQKALQDPEKLLAAQEKAREIDQEIHEARKRADAEHEKLGEQQAKLEGKIQDEQKELDEAEDRPRTGRQGTTMADRLTKIGLGAGAMYVPQADSAARSEKHLDKIRAEMVESRKALDEIKRKQALWNP